MAFSENILTEGWDFGKKYGSSISTPFTQKTDYYWKKLPNENNKTVMLIWCLEPRKSFILKFSISQSFFLQKQFLN